MSGDFPDVVALRDWSLGARSRLGQRAHRLESFARLPLLVPCGLAVVYVVLLVIRFPQLIRWENGDSDIASGYILADAISHGHAGHVVMSAQPSWAPLWYGLLTHGLSFHRVLWEISPALLALVAVVLITLTVANLSSPLRGALAAAVIVAASPEVLFNFTAAAHHNTTIAGAALLGAYMAWITSRPRRSGELVVASVLVSLIVGTFVASDNLLAVVGLLPFVAAALLRRLRTRDGGALPAVLAVAGGAMVVAIATSHVMRWYGFSARGQPGFALGIMPVHFEWLLQGLLRIGNGLSVAPHAGTFTPLVIAAGAASLTAIAAMCWSVARHLLRPGGAAAGRARDLWVSYWALSALCAAAAYVLTTEASKPSDRYLIIVVPAVAATLPLAVASIRSSWLTAAGATIFVVASIVALAAGDERSLIFDGRAVSEASAVADYVASQHLAVGYAGYWDAAALDWTTGGRLTLYPITEEYGPTEPMYWNRVQAWYRPRPQMPTYLLLAPGDWDLANHLPRDLPHPQREARIGRVTIAIYPYDIAAFFHRPPGGL